jgi:membrane protein YqaA with SNARE-associated domain
VIDVVVALTALVYGIGSAMIPVLNAEAYVAATALVLSGLDTVIMVVAITIGTVVGKVALFLAARAGRDLGRSRASSAETPRRPPGRVRRALRQVADLLISWLDHPVRAVATVLVSSSVGIPPLLAVAVVAGASRMRVGVFAAAVLVGRAGRFALIAGAAHGLV